MPSKNCRDKKNKEKQVLYKENPIMIFIKPPFLDILCLDEKKSLFIKPSFNYFLKFHNLYYAKSWCLNLHIFKSIKFKPMTETKEL